jgi:predicted transcriptional regulator
MHLSIRRHIDMSTTTIRLDEELKARIAAAAERSGKTAHAFILDALAQTVDQLETDEEFHRLADQRWASVLATGKTVPWDEARVYLEARARGEKVRNPLDTRRPLAGKLKR